MRRVSHVWDEEIARRAGYRSQVAPGRPSRTPALTAVLGAPGQPTHYPMDLGINEGSRTASRQPSSGNPPRPPANAGFFTDMTSEFFGPVSWGTTRLCLKVRVPCLAYLN